MTKLCISSILTSRDVFDVSCFVKKPFVDGIQVYQLECFENPSSAQGERKQKTGKNKAETEAIQEGALLQRWIEAGVFDAIEKQYLKSMQLIIATPPENAETDDINERVIESYTFKYAYSKDGSFIMAVDDHAQPCTKENCEFYVTYYFKIYSAIVYDFCLNKQCWSNRK